MSAEIEKQGRRRRRRDAEEESAEEESEENRSITAKKGRATVGRRNPQEEVRKLGPFGRAVRYIKGVQSELDKVSWPSREDTIRLTRIVLLVTIVASLILGAISFVFTELFVFGLQDPIIFLIVGVVVVAFIVGYSRYAANRRENTNFSSRL